MKRLRKYLLILLLAFSCCTVVSAQSTGQEITFNFQKQEQSWNSVEQSLDNLEQNLIELQINNNLLQKDLTAAQKSVNEQANFLAAQSLQLKDYETRLESSERTKKIWRTSFFISVGVSIPTITILIIIILANNTNK